MLVIRRTKNSTDSTLNVHTSAYIGRRESSVSKKIGTVFIISVPKYKIFLVTGGFKSFFFDTEYSMKRRRTISSSSSRGR